MSETLQSQRIEKRIADHEDPRLYRCDPRGIGYNMGICFHCGKGSRAYAGEPYNGPIGGPDMAMFVPSRETGERIVQLFKYDQWLDYRPSQPNWIQVKIVACKEHQPELEKLYEDIMATRERLDGPGIALSMLHPQAQGV